MLCRRCCSIIHTTLQDKLRHIFSTTDRQEIKLAKPNYQYEKRQKELAKKKKKEDKLKEKAQKNEEPTTDNPADTPEDSGAGDAK